MCGIFCLLNNRCGVAPRDEEMAFTKGRSRGPERSRIVQRGDQTTFGFHRLAINGLDKASDQPLTMKGCTLICNGEIYNYKELFKAIDVEPETNSDCEIIIHLYKLYGIDHTLRLLDGVFAFVLHDNSDYSRDPLIHVARDPLGVRPLYCLQPGGLSLKSETLNNGNLVSEWLIGFASELKTLNVLLNGQGHLAYHPVRDIVTPGTIFDENCIPYSIQQFEPGTVMTLSRPFRAHTRWRVERQARYFETVVGPRLFDAYSGSGVNDASKGICDHLNAAVRKRVVGTSDRPIACLLSGGLDSSLITALVRKYYPETLETFSIGMVGSEDLAYAQIVAKHLRTKHTEIAITPEEFFAAIPEVIRAIESYDTTTVRASVGNYLIGKYIKKHSDAKVIFNGDGSDELTGGYLYFLKSPSSLEFDNECRRLLRDIHAFDVLRSDKSISSHGLEPRTPFLDKHWVQFYLSIPVDIRNPLSPDNLKTAAKLGRPRGIEKQLLRNAFSMHEPGLLPDNVLWRTKEAFSDGVSGNAGNWFEIIRRKVADFRGSGDVKSFTTNTPSTNEQAYYRDIYEQAYPNTSHIVPYFWMPKYIGASDCSARTLDVYKTSSTESPPEGGAVGKV